MKSIIKEVSNPFIYNPEYFFINFIIGIKNRKFLNDSFRNENVSITVFGSFQNRTIESKTKNIPLEYLQVYT